jgi:hypothetical protein
MIFEKFSKKYMVFEKCSKTYVSEISMYAIMTSPTNLVWLFGTAGMMEVVPVHGGTPRLMTSGCTDAPASGCVEERRRLPESPTVTKLRGGARAGWEEAACKTISSDECAARQLSMLYLDLPARDLRQ